MKLLVQILAVCYHHDGTFREMLDDQVSEEQHGERFSASLRVPEHPDLALLLHGIECATERLVHGKILMVSPEYLPSLSVRLVKAKEVLYQVEQAGLVEDAMEEGMIVGYGVRFVLAILGFPLHVALLLGGKGSRTGGEHIRNHIEAIVHEQARNLLLVRLDLIVGIILAHPLIGRRFQLHDHDGKPVEHHHQVASLGGKFFHRPLVHDAEIILFRMVIIRQPRIDRTEFPAHLVFHRKSVLQIVGKGFVPAHQVRPVYFLQGLHHLPDAVGSQLRVDASKRLFEHRLVERIPIIAFDVIATLVGISHVLEQGDNGLLVTIFGKAGCVHPSLVFALGRGLDIGTKSVMAVSVQRTFSLAIFQAFYPLLPEYKYVLPCNLLPNDGEIPLYTE